MYSFNKEEYLERMQWYTDARFGMFIHWGLYAIPARGEWVRSTERISKEDYLEYFYEFNPKGFDPTSWVHSDYPHIVFADLGPSPKLPDSIDTVLEIELN